MMRWPEICRKGKEGFQKSSTSRCRDMGGEKPRPKLFPEGVKRAITVPSIMTWCMQGGIVMNRGIARLG